MIAPEESLFNTTPVGIAAREKTHANLPPEILENERLIVAALEHARELYAKHSTNPEFTARFGEAIGDLINSVTGVLAGAQIALLNHNGTFSDEEINALMAEEAKRAAAEGENLLAELVDKVTSALEAATAQRRPAA